MLIVCAFLLFAAFTVPASENRFVYQAAVGLCAISAFLGSYIQSRSKNWPLTLLFFYVCSFGAVQSLFAEFYFNRIGPLGAARFASVIIGAVFTAFLMGTFYVLLTETLVLSLMVFLGLMSFIDSFGILYCHLRDGTSYLMLNNPALDGSFISMFIPFQLVQIQDKYSKVKNHKIKNAAPSAFVFVIMVSAIIATGSSTAWAACGLSIGVYFWSKYLRKAAVLGLCLFGGIIWWVAGSLMMGREWLNDNGRLNTMWKPAMDVLFHGSPWQKIFGFGPGTFALYGPAIQISRLKVLQGTVQVFFWLHNEWLQILFEMGIFGLGLALFAYAFVLKKSFGSPLRFSMVVTFGFIAFFQPLRQFPFELLMVGLLGLS